ncbi:IS110 family transposase [Cedecea sp. NFIX57]|uniref:IS110 family transposase n=1 Tax=Cedecea sp. NFIX57 TaxID=1566286 RepID=UPI000A0A83CE|nr:IS110 family transposase [Cedecea sp. NFIX57]SMG29446.1 Transposase [Cedecea sp. NFIX57]
MTLIPVGVDIAKLKFDVAVLLPNQKYKTKKFANTPAGCREFIHWLARFGECHVCMEATGSYSTELATALSDGGYCVSLENPARIHAFSNTELTRNKTDKSDAALIARYCALHQPAQWHPAPLSQRQLTALVRHLKNLEEMRQMEENRLEAADEVITGSLKEHIATLDELIKETKKKIRQHIDDDPDLRKDKALLESIPGVGDVLSTSLLAFAGNLRRFSSSKALVAYAGLNPRRCESGMWKGKSRLSKVGSSELRSVLYMPAVVAGRCNEVVKDLMTRMGSRGKTGKEHVCAGMRKLLQLAYGVVKSGREFNAEIPLAG